MLPAACLLLLAAVAGAPRVGAQARTRSPHGGLRSECTECHSSDRWVPVSRQPSFRHDKTGFPLEGSHAQVDCRACHKTLVFSQVGAACIDCHKDPHNGQLGTRCESCHTPRAFTTELEIFKVHNRERLVLFAIHAAVPCDNCHRGQKTADFRATPTACAACHQKDAASTRNPNHVLAGFTQACETCHSTVARTWQRTTYKHTPAFPLHGAHATVACSACHAQRFSGTPKECVDCHLQAFNTSKNPSHLGSGFPTQCAACHRDTSWRPATFKSHGQTRFPLTGRHQAVTCAQCHVGGKYTGTPTNCVACHQSKFQGTKNPNHVAAAFPTTCATCHTTNGWTPATWDHGRTRFPLSGAHQKAACAQCHPGGRTKGTPSDCYACHQAQFQGTKNPNHQAAGFPTACVTCHTANSWRPASRFDHNTSRFPLTGAHAGVDCAKCHTGGQFTRTPTECFSCHQVNYQTAKSPDHTGFPRTCASCHSTRSWRPASMVDHNRTRFPLTGAHQRTDCARCHVGGSYAGTPTDCYACHQANYAATTNPNHAAGRFPTTCASCHTTNAWHPATFADHNKTRFPLTGRHQGVACAQCHVGGKYTGTSMDCYSCHQAKYQATTNPNHPAAGIAVTCADCHATSGWTPARFDHDKTRFPLLGPHRNVDCVRCHVNGRYTGTPADCYSCHQANYVAARNPNHVAGGFPTVCVNCHTVNAWRPATFTDHSKTRFPLSGAHQAVACVQCHVGGRYTGTPTDCYACHQAKYQATSNPNHPAAGFATTCASCHTTNAWVPATFDHAKTRFPLAGAHRSVACVRCHAGGKYTGTPTDCYACHQANYAATTNPNHLAGHFPTTCAGCHTTNGWRPASFTDHSKTRFPLTGAHQSVACAQCHVGGKYTGTATDCYACHQAKYQATTNPNHAAAGFATTCATCHTTNGWRPANWNHNTTRFPLTGKHVTVACAQCHVGGKYTGTATDCYACHQAKYQATTNPNHVAAGFATTCATCHTTNGWTPATFDHGKTRFPLTGKHQTVSCVQCHVGGKYTGTATDCYACHQAKYQATTNPNHVAAGFATTCASCHTTNGWTPATFDHGKTRFPLTGKHATVSCVQCHVGGKYTGTATDCYACHQAKYQATTSPNHVAAGFATTCATCHTTNGWRPANWNHNTTRFPLTGKHVTVACAQCHVGGKYTGTATDCYACHQAKYQATTNPNHVAAGFATTCASCHTTNGWTPATFDHGKTRFPLTGKHQTVSCVQCHVGREVHGHGDGLLRVPPGEVPGDDEPEPRGSRLRHDLRELPHDERLDPRHLRPRQDALPAHGQACDRGVRPVPREREVHGHRLGLLLLPPGEVPGHQEPEPFGGGLPDHLPDLPHHERLDARQLVPHPVPHEPQRRQDMWGLPQEPQ